MEFTGVFGICREELQTWGGVRAAKPPAHPQIWVPATAIPERVFYRSDESDGMLGIEDN